MNLRWIVIPILAVAFQACKGGDANNKKTDLTAIPVLKLEVQDTSLPMIMLQSYKQRKM